MNKISLVRKIKSDNQYYFSNLHQELLEEFLKKELKNSA